MGQPVPFYEQLPSATSECFHGLSKVQLAKTTPGHQALPCQRMGPAQQQRFGLESKVLKCFVVLGRLVFCEFIRSSFSDPQCMLGKRSCRESAELDSTSHASL